jgi:hypothetical protein
VIFRGSSRDQFQTLLRSAFFNRAREVRSLTADIQLDFVRVHMVLKMMVSMRSLMMSELTMGPSIEPWTTPLRIGAKLESSFPIETHWDRPLRYDFIKEVTVELNLKMVESFLQRKSWITLSKAFEKSRNSRTITIRRSQPCESHR